MKGNRILLLAALVVLCSMTWLPQRKTVVHLVGDSTMSAKQVRYFPETGWGMPFQYFFDSTVEVINHAKNGRSSKTFRAEGLWAPVVGNLQPGDYVFIQFGHNDEVKEKVVSYTTPTEFSANLEAYVAEVKAKGAQAVLLTPVARRRFDSTGRLVDTHPEYSNLVRNVARKAVVPLIDLDTSSAALLRQWGVGPSKLLFNHLQPGEHPNYPGGRQDDTHFSELGARKMAQLVLAEIRNLKLDLASHIVAPK